MITTGEGEEEMPEETEGWRREMEDEIYLLPAPASPPGKLATLPAMEVDFPTTLESPQPSPHQTIDPRILWEGFADLNQKLGKYGYKFRKMRDVLAGWQPKLTTLAEMVMDMHYRQSVLISRFRDIEGQDPIGNMFQLYTKQREFTAELKEWQEHTRELRSAFSEGGQLWLPAC